MKKFILISFSLFIFTFGNSQGLIGDLMNVETVNIELTEENEKLKAEYDETLEKETADLDEDLAKYDESYQKEVGRLIEDFSKKLVDGEEKIVLNEKKRVVSRVKSLTMSLKKNKKDAVQRFMNSLQIANRSLPDFMRSDAGKEVKDKASEKLKFFDEEYVANLDAVRGFEKKEHLVINNNTSASTN